MALCPYCHSEKPVEAPVCHECNHDTPILFQAMFSLCYGAITLATFVAFGFAFIWIFAE